ncbi:nucleolar complex-associated protein [Biscogniauxia sp. FL1348]|nr:nucleolar complex-associated protein [Biscogniauxia sp. FL1348]
MASRPAKKRRLTPPQSDDDGSSQKSNGKIQKAFFKNAASWDLEQEYENKARKGKKKEKKENTRLPLKLPGGRLQHVSAPVDDLKSIESDEDWLEASGDESGVEGGEDPIIETKPDVPEHQQILEAKEELAKAAMMLNENPEENVGALKTLAKIGQSRLPTIRKLALATQLAVYKDVIPGYRIRPIAEDGPEEKLSKEVRKLRSWEQSLVSGYQAYVKELAKCAKARSHQGGQRGNDISSVAITCACTLLTSVPHFNFRGDLIKILVGKLSTRWVDQDFHKCLEAFETLFADDEEGRPAMEAVSLLSKMMKAREYEVNENVVNLFLHLRLLSEFGGKASKDSVEHEEDSGLKKRKFKKEFRTKKLRKNMKEQKALQKDMAQADALVSHEERDRMQSETLKLVFATYFRILKLRVPHLMGAVLEGLAKYAHLINQDFFGDLLEALKDLIRHSDADEEEGEEKGQEDDDDDDAPVRNTSREALLCTVTAFALLAGQDAHNARSTLHLDLSFFTAHLYQTLLPLSLAPPEQSLQLPDPDAPPSKSPLTTTTGNAKPNKINVQTTPALLIRCLAAVLLPTWNARSVSPLRLAAFAKQLMTASLHLPEKPARAVLGLLADVTAQHGRKFASLWDTDERKGDGAFRPLSPSVEAANPLAATVWEGEILRRHYCPQVRDGLRAVERGIARER